MAAACACWKPCDCACRTWTSRARKSWCATARVPRTGDDVALLACRPFAGAPRSGSRAACVAVAQGYGGVELPDALARKYPRAHLDWSWQYVFPARNPSVDRAPVCGDALTCSAAVQSHMQNAVRRAHLGKPRAAIPSVTASPLTCSSRAPTSERYRSFLVTPT